jgi:DNA-directed RNA polymerase specialized sigma24 family protein/CheY-like chemotaxis protein
MHMPVSADVELSGGRNLLSLSQAIAAELPRLRRFARALTGSQESGDAYVVATLQALVADASLVPTATEAKSSLYRLFLTVWNSVDVNCQPSLPSDNPTTTAASDRRLQAIAPMAREAFLLTAVEGFSSDEAAKVLNVNKTRLTHLLDEASRQIAEETATTALIIEDEPLIALDVAELLRQLGHKVIGVARTHDEAVAIVKAHSPGLVVADIRLADGSSGLEAVQEILHSISVPVIFITAFPERLLTGQRPEPTYVLSKPYRPEAVRALVSQAIFFHTGSQSK